MCNFNGSTTLKNIPKDLDRDSVDGIQSLAIFAFWPFHSTKILAVWCTYSDYKLCIIYWCSEVKHNNLTCDRHQHNEAKHRFQYIEIKAYLSLSHQKHFARTTSWICNEPCIFVWLVSEKRQNFICSVCRVDHQYILLHSILIALRLLHHRGLV